MTLRSRLRLAWNLLDGVDQVGEALERIVLALHRNDHAMRRAQTVQGQHRQRWRAVDEHEIVAIRDLSQSIAQAILAPIELHQLDFRTGKVAIRRQDIVLSRLGSNTYSRQFGEPDQQVVNRVLERPLVDAAAHGGIAPWIEVDQQHPLPGLGQCRGKIHAGSGLANPTLLVGDAKIRAIQSVRSKLFRALHPQRAHAARRITSRCRAASRSGTVSSTARSSSKPWGSRASSSLPDPRPSSHRNDHAGPAGGRSAR